MKHIRTSIFALAYLFSRSNSALTSEGEALKPSFHITAPHGWSNDPNGLMEYRNVTHAFFQWNPNGNVWGPPVWAHVISSDLVFWKRLPVALSPGTEYDADGVFSGSAAFQADGTPLLFYTGVSQFEKLGYYYQIQAVALPANASDPELVEWHKPPSNPLELTLPPGGTHSQFRDPTTPFAQDGKMWLSVGGQVHCIGTAILYSSRDSENWELEGKLAHEVSTGESDGQCSASSNSTSNPGNGQCDQIGEECHTWECIDFFELDDGVFVIKWSDQVNVRTQYAIDWYVVVRDIQSDSEISQVFLNTTDTPPRIIDYGSVYASKTWRASDGRRLWMGWVYETAVGCQQQCSKGSPFTENLGWQGVQTVPRVVTYDQDSDTLLFNPVEEVSKLRKELLVHRAVSLDESSTPETASILVESSHLVQSEILALFNMTRSQDETAFALGAVIRFDQHSRVHIEVNGTYEAGFVTEAYVFVDRSDVGGHTNAAKEGGEIPMPPGGILASYLELHILVDRSLIEVFALGGRGRIATRVYPSGMLNPNWALGIYGSSDGATALPESGIKATASVWALKSCWVDSIGA